MGLRIQNLVTLMRLFSFYIPLLFLVMPIWSYAYGTEPEEDKQLDPSESIDSLVTESVEKNFSEPSQSLALALEAIKKAEYTNNDTLLGKAYRSVGLSYDLLGEDHLALRYFQQALNEFEKRNDSINISQTLNNIGVVYDELGDYDEALSYYLRSLAALGNANEPKKIVSVYNNIGLIYQENGLFDEALENLYHAYNLSVENDLKSIITYPLHSIGEVYLDMGIYDSALYYFKRSYQFDDSLKDQNGLAVNLQSMGKVYISQQKFDEAEPHLKEALQIQTDIEDKFEHTRTLILLGELYLQKNSYHRALSYARKALEFAENSKTKSQVRDASMVMSKIFKREGNFREALHYSDLSNIYKDSIYNEVRNKRLALLHLNKKEAENEALTTDIEFKSAILDDQQVLIEKQTYVVIFVSLGLILSFIVLSVLMNSNKDKNLANQRLLKQKQEIEKIIRELTVLNENINRQKNDRQRSNQIQDKLLSIISHDFRSPLNSLEGILDLMSQGRISPEEMQMISKELRVKVNITTSLLDNLLNWAKSQMQGIKPNPEVFDVKNLVDDTLHLLSTQAERKEVRIYNRVENSQSVFSDYEMTKLIVRNLVSNAIKFTSAGDKIFVKTSVDDGLLQFIVKDTGKGISFEEKKNLFTNDSKSTLGTAYEKGTGLGLLLCKDFVEKNGGTISVESEEGEGSTFMFTIPLSEQEVPQVS